MKTYLIKICPFVIAAALFWLSASPVLAREGVDTGTWIPQTAGPTGDAFFFPQDRPAPAPPDPAWVVRTGAKKGVRDGLLDEELFAGPDAAVLKSGFFDSWPALLAGFKEPSVLVEPDRIAGLEKTKPFLIIPTGGLRGVAGSIFFKAGLEEYARSGGVIICFAQQRGADFSALPVPAGGKLEARGWEEDAGPLFRASSVRNRHPALAGTRKDVPDVESSGYLTSCPAEAVTLLSRNDGSPTLIVYPYGAGRIVVTTLFPDFSHAYERLEPEENILIRNLLLWAKAPDRTVLAQAGDRIELSLTLPGPEQAEAAAIRIIAVGPAEERIEPTRQLSKKDKADQPAQLILPYSVPSGLKPGVYSLEYALLDKSGNDLSRTAESGSGFSVGQPPTASPRKETGPAPADTPLRLLMQARWDSKKTNRLLVDIVADRKAASGADKAFLLRALGKEQRFTPGPEKTTLSFDISEPVARGPVLIVAYDPAGRSLSRLVLPAPSADNGGPILDRPSYLPGDPVTVKLSGIGKGELTLVGPGHIENQVVSGGFRATFALPAPLPAGAYGLQWTLESLASGARSGEGQVNVAGYRVQVREASLDSSGAKGKVACRFGIRSDQTVQARMKLQLRKPDGTLLPVVEKPIAIVPGDQDMTLDLPFKPDRSGIWEVRYALSAPLPSGPGFSAEPVSLASGRMLLDAGNAALLGVVPAKPVHYDPTGPVDLSVYVFGSGKAAIEVYRDDKKSGKEKLTLSGLSVIPFSLPAPGPGNHRMKAVLAGDPLDGEMERPFIYGVRLPELSVSLRTGELTALVAPVSVIVRNSGRSPSGPGSVALYEGDSAKKGRMIGKADIPPLAADAQHLAVIDWNLSGKAGVRTLTAVVDADPDEKKTTARTGAASLKVDVPELVLAVKPRKDQVNADEGIAYTVTAANLAAGPKKDLGLRFEVMGPGGNTLSSESEALADLSPGSEKRIDRTFLPSNLPAGVYRLQARLSQGAQKALTSASSAATVLPTLKVTGTLAETPRTAAQCLPFAIKYGAKNAGNIPVSMGYLKLAVKTAGSGVSSYTGQFPFSTDTNPLRFERMELPQGAYVITLSASVTNAAQGMTREFLLAEQPLNVKAPAEITQGRSPLPRVLAWTGKSTSMLEQAIAQNIVKQAFTDDEVFYRTAASAEEFKNQALGGLYNIFVLFEIDETLEQPAWLQDRIERGGALVIIGSGDESRRVAELFGFRFNKTPLIGKKSSITFPGDSGMGLSGSVPLSGSLYLPFKEGAKPAALLDAGPEPLALIDKAGTGRVLVMPFSVVRSARDAGTTPPYSLLLRSSVRGVAPDESDEGAIRGGELLVTATAGAVKTRVMVTLPQGARVLWVSEGGTETGNTVFYEITADTEPRRIQYLYRNPKGNRSRPSAELSYECNGKFLRQGKVE